MELLLGRVSVLFDIRVLAIKIIQPIIPSNLKKAKFIPAHFDCVCDERIAEIAFRSPKNTNLVSKKGKIGWHREAQQIFEEHGEEVPVCDNSTSTAAAQQQHSSSSRSSSGGGGGGGGEGGVGGGSTASFFSHSCRSSTRGPPEGEERPYFVPWYKKMVDASSPRLMSRSILVHIFWPPLLLDLLLLLLLCRRRRRYCCCCCCCCAVACVPKNTKRETVC